MPMPHGSAAAQRGGALRIVVPLLLLVVILAGVVVGFMVLYKQVWSASAFAERYVENIADSDAAGALAMPGVTPQYDALEEIGRGTASEALLRSSALMSEITDIRAVGERSVAGDVTEVSVRYNLDGTARESVFRIQPQESEGLVPSWGFETSPLSVIDLTVRGSWRFSVNGFEIDKRQISPAGLDADPLEPVSLLTFSPGDYEVAVDTTATVADPETVVATGPLDVVPLDVQTRPTSALTDVVQSSVDDFLDATCTTQNVLQPADCPFGFDTSWGIAQPDIEWSINDYPQTALVPDGDGWKVSATSGTAHVNLSVQCYAGGFISVDQDVFFTMVADVEVQDDGGVHITIDRQGDPPPTPNLCAFPQ